MQLEDRVAVVTGATSGLGMAIARRFAREGARLILNARGEARGERLVEELRQDGADARLVAGDVGDEQTAAAIAQAARDAHGRIDALVLNAGVGDAAVGRFWEVTPEQFDLVMRTNVRGVWLCARAGEPLLSDGASVIVMSSVSAFMVFADDTVYSASKGALTQLVRGMAGDLADRGIRVNALCPGVINAGMTRGMIEGSANPEVTEREFASESPLGRMGTAEEIASAAVFLASTDSSFMTGASLVCDGGVLIR